jgi:hypothetical protein
MSDMSGLSYTPVRRYLLNIVQSIFSVIVFYLNEACDEINQQLPAMFFITKELTCQDIPFK